MPRRKNIIRLHIIFFAVVCFFLICNSVCVAQTGKCVEKISQNYISFGDDIKTYQIIYDPTNEKDYVAYSELIREKIKQKLKNIYSSYDEEGDVCLLFVLKSDGSLYALNIDPLSASNKKLRDMATFSVRKAAPFPSFPTALAYDRMFFSVVISFQKNG